MILVVLFMLACITGFLAYKFSETFPLVVTFIMFFIFGCFGIPVTRDGDRSFIKEYNQEVNLISLIDYFDCNSDFEKFSTEYKRLCNLEEEIRLMQEKNKSIWFGIYHTDDVNNVKLDGLKLFLSKCTNQRVEKE
jgi:hypothetical protein